MGHENAGTVHRRRDGEAVERKRESFVRGDVGEWLARSDGVRTLCATSGL